MRVELLTEEAGILAPQREEPAAITEDDVVPEFETYDPPGRGDGSRNLTISLRWSRISTRVVMNY
jgi:hypothetical protein